MIRRTLLIGIVVAAASDVALAQPGSVVQLPTFTSFSVATTVSVPDSGGAYVAAMKRGAAGRVSSGLGPCLGQLSYGVSRSADGLSIGATVHDLHGLDVQMLVATGGGSPLGEVSRKLAQAPHIANSGGLESVAEIKARRSGIDPAHELVSLLSKAREAEAAGKPGLAKIHYQMALRRASGPERPEIVAKLKQLSSPKPELAAKPAQID